MFCTQISQSSGKKYEFHHTWKGETCNMPCPFMLWPPGYNFVRCFIGFFPRKLTAGAIYPQSDSPGHIFTYIKSAVRTNNSICQLINEHANYLNVKYTFGFKNYTVNVANSAFCSGIIYSSCKASWDFWAYYILSPKAMLFTLILPSNLEGMGKNLHLEKKTKSRKIPGSLQVLTTYFCGTI